MRRLLLLRHAKTERTNMRGDHARCLIERGREDAVRMGVFLQKENLVPDHALVSDATRTQQTFGLVAQGLGRTLPVEFEGAIYLAEPSVILGAIRATPDAVATLLVIGHNPGLHQLAFDLGRRGPHKLVAALAAKFSTCTLAVIECDAPAWQELHAANCRLARYMTAKSLRANLSVDADDDC